MFTEYADGGNLWDLMGGDAGHGRREGQFRIDLVVNAEQAVLASFFHCISFGRAVLEHDVGSVQGEGVWGVGDEGAVKQWGRPGSVWGGMLAR